MLFQSNLASDYCWIHGSGYIPRKYQPHMKCITNLDGVEYGDEGEEAGVEAMRAGLSAIRTVAGAPPPRRPDNDFDDDFDVI